MLPARGNLKPRYSLDLAKQTPYLRQEIDQMCQYWSGERPRVLSKASIHRYLKDIYGMLGWLNTVKAIPLENLSLATLVPIDAMYDSASAHQTVELVAEYLEWLISERNIKPATQRCVLEVISHIAEFFYHVHQIDPAQITLTEVPVVQELRAFQARLGLVWYPKTTSRHRHAPYALTTDKISNTLRQQIDNFLEFITDSSSYSSYQDNGVRIETAMMRINHLYRALGYLHHHLNVSWETLTLEHLVVLTPIKTAQRQATCFEELKQIEQAAEHAAEETIAKTYRYIRWLRQERQISPGTEVLVFEAMIAVAKFLYREETNLVKFKNYEDIPVIQLLRSGCNQAKERASNTPSTVDESIKWLDWPEFLECVRQLERECLFRYKGGTARSQAAIAASVQRFLIAALLAYMPPDRQRTLRELEEGKTLIKGILRQQGNKVWIEPCPNGQWHIRLQNGDYKTSEKYGEQIHVVPDLLYPHLEAWIDHWRSVFNPQHSFVFTQQNGQPFLTASSFLSVFKRAVFRITGKATTPHLTRHMIITYLKRQGASDAVMQSLAIAMHHSEETQRKSYDRRTPYEQSSCAQEVVLTLAKGNSLSNHLTNRPITVEAILKDVHQLSVEEQQRLIQSLQSLQ